MGLKVLMVKIVSLVALGELLGACIQPQIAHAEPDQRATSLLPAISSLEPRPEKCRQYMECIIRVRGSWARAGGNRLHLEMLVRPLPNRSDQSYWVEGKPEVDSEGRWLAEPVYIGRPGDRPGWTFKVCVVATVQVLGMGQQLASPPPGPITCIEILRGSR